MVADLELKPDFDHQRFDQAITRAWVDPDYRQWLIANPKEALVEEGVELPEEVTVVVHEFDMNKRHIFLPSVSQIIDDSPNGYIKLNRPPNVPRVEPHRSDISMNGIARPFLVPPAFDK